MNEFENIIHVLLIEMHQNKLKEIVTNLMETVPKLFFTK